MAAARPARIALLALLAGALGIAFAPIFVRLSEAGPTATAFWRLALALPALALWMRVERGGEGRAARRPQGWSDHWRLALAGAFFAGDLAVWHLSVQMTSVANATLFPNFAPIVVAFLSWAIFGQRFTATFLAGLAAAMAGALVLLGDSLDVSRDHLVGDLLGLLTAVFYGGYILAVGRLRAEFSTATIMTWSGVVTALVLAPLAMLSGEALLPATLAGWGVLAALALLSHAGGQSLIAYALAHLPAAFSSVALLLQPAAAAVLAWMLFDEALSWPQAIGGVAILAGIVLARLGSLGQTPAAAAPLTRAEAASEK